MTYIGALFVHQWDIDRWTLADALYVRYFFIPLFLSIFKYLQNESI